MKTKIFIFTIFLLTISLLNQNASFCNLDKKDESKNSQEKTYSWPPYHSIIGKFKVTFPLTPQHEVKSVQVPNIDYDIRYEVYSCTIDPDLAYVVSSVEYPQEVNISNPEVNLEGSLNGILNSTPNNELVSSDFTTHDKYKALDFIIKNGFIMKNKELYIKGKIIILDKRAYTLMYQYTKDKYNEYYYNKFVNSFEILWLKYYSFLL